MTKIKPLHNNVLVEIISKEDAGTKTKSGIFIPETVDKEIPEKGKVVEIGPGRKNDDGKLIPMSVKKGQVVIYSYSSRELQEDGKKYAIVGEESILAIIE